MSMKQVQVLEATKAAPNSNGRRTAGIQIERIRVGMMAEDIGVSKYVLSRIFSKTFHRNFNQYLNDERLNYAIRCLEHSDLSITQICMDSGFDSQRTFNRVFKERYKVTPREYRKGRTE